MVDERNMLFSVPPLGPGVPVSPLNVGMCDLCDRTESNQLFWKKNKTKQNCMLNPTPLPPFPPSLCSQQHLSPAWISCRAPFISLSFCTQTFFKSILQVATRLWSFSRWICSCYSLSQTLNNFPLKALAKKSKSLHKTTTLPSDPQRSVEICLLLFFYLFVPPHSLSYGTCKQ